MAEGASPEQQLRDYVQVLAFSLPARSRGKFDSVVQQDGISYAVVAIFPEGAFGQLDISDWGDIAESAGIGLVNGFADVAELPGDIQRVVETRIRLLRRIAA